MASAQNNLPQGLLSSLCYVESHHNVSAIHPHDGHGNSVGICEIKLAAAKQMGYTGPEKGLMDPSINIYYAGKFLSYQIKRYNGNIKKGITAYNKGHSDGDGNSTYYTKVDNIWRKSTHLASAKSSKGEQSRVDKQVSMQMWQCKGNSRYASN